MPENMDSIQRIDMVQTASYKKALNLEYFTVSYNFLEAIASILAGYAANSIALVAFGLDSIITCPRAMKSHKSAMQSH